MSIVLEQVGLLFIFMFCGYLFGKSKLVNYEHTKILSVLGIYMFLPCTVFNAFHTNFTLNNLTQYYMLFIVAIILLSVLVCISYFASGLFSKDKYERNVYKYTLIISNYGYMGYALAQGLFGEEGLLYIILFALPFSLFTYTFGYCMLTNREITFKRLINPAIISIMVGAVFGILNLEIPFVIETFIKKSSNCMAPVSMLLTGITLSEFNIKELVSDKKVYIVSVVRLILIPGVVLVILRPFLDESIVRTAVLLCAMPCGLNTIIFPKLIGASCRLGAKLAFVSNILALVSIPLVLNFI